MEMMIIMVILSFIGNSADEIGDDPTQLALDNDTPVESDGGFFNDLLGGLDDAVINTVDDVGGYLPSVIGSASKVTVANDAGLLESVGGKEDSSDMFSDPLYWAIGGIGLLLLLRK